MAFSGGVPVVVVREFPSEWGERKTTEDVFFLADQECPGLEVFPLLVREVRIPHTLCLPSSLHPEQEGKTRRQRKGQERSYWLDYQRHKERQNHASVERRSSLLPGCLACWMSNF
ncbi:hypothetical protein FQN60_004090 [Etheostoma spectabile]|uniref:Uncharacterized protein n=1 Tax=Etheostoma spectabile TaxID=54343 RepID=A0A5J5CXI8_9PERO|nr:hypothetical protein FQN60_004090 [Etheostoma spectabile]